MSQLSFGDSVENLMFLVSQSYLTSKILACGLFVLPTKAKEITILSSLTKFEQIPLKRIGSLEN